MNSSKILLSIGLSVLLISSVTLTQKAEAKVLTYSTTFVNTINHSCTNNNIKSTYFYSELAGKYLNKYGIAHENVGSACISYKIFLKNQAKYTNSDLPIVIFDSGVGVALLAKNVNLGHYTSGYGKIKQHILFVSPSPFVETQSGAWILSHELSHFALKYKGYKKSINVDWVHEQEDIARNCHFKYSSDLCNSVKTTLKSPFGKTMDVMRIYNGERT